MSDEWVDSELDDCADGDAADTPAFTVGRYGPVIEYRDGQWYRDGVPFEPDPPPISEGLTDLLDDAASNRPEEKT